MAAQLSRASYGKNLPPPEWKLIDVQTTSDGKDSVSVYSNGSIAVMAFKGSDNVTNFKNDLLNSGYKDWHALEPLAEIAFSRIPGNLKVVTTGHSLGGGMSQTFALKHGLDGFGQNALPVTGDALNEIATAKGMTTASVLSSYRASRSFSEVNTKGDPATMYYSDLQGQVYLSLNPTTLPSSFVAMEVTGTLLAAVPSPLSPYGAAMVAKAAAEAHSIDTTVLYLGGKLTGAADNVLVDTRLNTDRSYIVNTVLSSYLDSSGNVTTADGSRVGVVLNSETANAANYSLSLGNEVPRDFTVATGTGVFLNKNDAYCVALGQTSLQIAGSGNKVFGETGAVINAGGNGAYGTGAAHDVVYAPGATVNLLDNSNVDVYAANGVVNSGVNDFFGAYGGGITVNGGGAAAIWVDGSYNYARTTVNANGAVVTVAAGSSNISISDSNATVFGSDHASFDVLGSNLTVNGGVGSYITVGGNGKFGAVNKVVLQDAANFTAGDNSNVDVVNNRSASNSELEFICFGNNTNAKLSGTGDMNMTHEQLQGSGTNLTVTAGNYYNNFVESGSNNLVNLNCPATTVKLHGTGSRVNLNSGGTKAELWGDDEQVYVPPDGTAQSWCFFGRNGKLVRVPLGGFGFAGDRQTADATINSLGAVASALKISDNDVLGLDTAERAQQQLQTVLKAPAEAALTGGRWDHKEITWSVDGQNSGFSANMGEQEEQQIARAFDAWAAASGLTFREVHGDTAADINLGWSRFDTAHSGVVGYTSYETNQDGHIESGVTIRVEDRTETGLQARNGELIYDGTDASLSQVLMHEIGHAIGLADTANARSIESYYLDAGNRTLSAGDCAAVRALYSNFSADTGASSTDQLIQSMASFAPPAAMMHEGMARSQRNISQLAMM